MYDILLINNLVLCNVIYICISYMMFYVSFVQCCTHTITVVILRILITILEVQFVIGSHVYIDMDGSFYRPNVVHRSMMMTASDIAAITKPWEVQKRVGW